MAQHDYVIDNQASASARADLNSLFQAIASQNSGATAPTTTYANMIWYDTATDLLKMRNEANSAWITLGTLDQALNTFTAPSVNGKTINTLTAAGGIAYASSTSVLAAIGAGTAGQVLLSGGAGAPTWGSAGGVNIQVFTATGTYTPTSGYKYGIAFVTGGGGGSAGISSGTSSGRGGGGGAGTAIGLLDLTTLGAVTATIGAAGSGGASTSPFTAGAGGNSTLSTLTGAGGSAGNVGTTGANGGSASGGILNIDGSRSHAGGSATSGGGGGTFWGPGPGGSDTTAYAATVYGAGAAGPNGGSTRSGAAGKAGVIMIMEFK